MQKHALPCFIKIHLKIDGNGLLRSTQYYLKHFKHHETHKTDERKIRYTYLLKLIWNYFFKFRQRWTMMKVLHNACAKQSHDKSARIRDVKTQALFHWECNARKKNPWNNNWIPYWILGLIFEGNFVQKSELIYDQMPKEIFKKIVIE